MGVGHARGRVLRRVAGPESHPRLPLGRALRHGDQDHRPSLALIGIVLAISGRIWIAVLLTLPFALLLPVELFYILKYRAPLDSQVVGAVIESNVAEASAFMAGLWTPLWSSMLAAALAWILVLACAKSPGLHGRAVRAWVGAGAIASAGIIFSSSRRTRWILAGPR